jgi:uncharacterized membrane protein YfcA
MVIFFPPQVAVPVIVILDLFINVILFIENRENLDLKRIWPLMVAGAFGVPVGAYMLVILDAALLKMFIGFIIILFSLAFLKGYKRKLGKEKIAFGPVGFISGFLKGFASIGGPPVVLFFANQDVKKDIFRANIVAYFVTLGLMAIPSYFMAGLLTGEVINNIILFLPAMIIGALIGIKLSKKVDEKFFKRVVLIILIFSGITAILSGLGIL